MSRYQRSRSPTPEFYPDEPSSPEFHPQTAPPYNFPPQPFDLRHIVRRDSRYDPEPHYTPPPVSDTPSYHPLRSYTSHQHSLSDRNSTRTSLGVSQSSRVTKRSAITKKRKKTFQTIAKALTGTETESQLREHLNLFTFHQRYTPFRPPPRGGRGPRGRPHKRSIFGDHDEYVKNYWETHPQPRVDKQPSDREFLRPCAVVQMNHLLIFNKPTHRMPTTFSIAWKKAVEYVNKLLALDKKLRFPTADQLDDVRFDPRKFAGVEYARKGLKTRGDAHLIALQHAKEAWACLMKGERVKPHDVRLGGKGKIRDKAPPGTPLTENLVGRLILMLSHRDLLVLGNVEQIITEAYLDPKYPIAAGFRWCHGEPTKFADFLEQYNMLYCLDAYKFDANVTEWLVTAALDILQNQFEDGKSADYDQYWDFVSESMVRVIIQRDDGIRLQKHQGSTSGHNFNSIVQSVITLLVGYTTFFHMAPEASFEEAEKRAYLLSFGDELLMGLKRPYSEWTVEEIADVALEGCGVDWHGRKSFRTTQVVDEYPGDHRGILFLGKRLRQDKFFVRGQLKLVATPYRPFQETLESLYYPQNHSKHGRDAILRTYERALAAYIDAAGNPETRKWLDSFLSWLEQKGAKKPEEWGSDQRNNFLAELREDNIHVPNPERWDLQHWMEHTHLPRTNPRVETRDQRRQRMMDKQRRIRVKWARLGLQGGNRQAGLYQ